MDLALALPPSAPWPPTAQHSQGVCCSQKNTLLLRWETSVSVPCIWNTPPFPQPSILHPPYHCQGQMTLEQYPVLILSILKIILKNYLCNCLTSVLQSWQSSVAAGLSSSGQHRAWYNSVLTTCKGKWMNEWVIRDCLRPWGTHSLDFRRRKRGLFLPLSSAKGWFN